MTLVLSAIIESVRDRDPGLVRERVPDAVLARYFTGLQRQLYSGGAGINRDAFTTAHAEIVFALESENAVGTAGAGTDGGLPVEASSAEVLSQVGETSGYLGEIDFDDDDAVVLVSESVVASATSTTLTKTSAGWTVDAYAGEYVRITAGPGAGQHRSITSNTADTLTVSEAWVTTPTSASLFEIVDPVIETDGDMAVVTTAPPTDTRTGYLVKFTSAGVPYLDLASPLVATFDRGIPLPAFSEIGHGTVRYTNDEDTRDDLTFVPAAERHRVRAWPAAYVMGGELFLCGLQEDWEDVQSIELRYVPVPDAFTARTDVFLLPDHAYEVLVAKGAAFGAVRVGSPAAPVLAQMAQSAEAAFYETLRQQRRSRIRRIREVM